MLYTHPSRHTYNQVPLPPGGATRWLGIWFDQRMSFGKHCRTLAAKAKQTAAGIKSLANTVRGAHALLLRHATVACVISVFRRLFRTRSFPSHTRLTRNHLPWLEGVEQIDPLTYPPWHLENINTIRDICPTRDRAGVDFQQWADTRPPLSMFIFSDGSRLNNSDTPAGAGWYGYWVAWKQESACGHLSLPQHEV